MTVFDRYFTFKRSNNAAFWLYLTFQISNTLYKQRERVNRQQCQNCSPAPQKTQNQTQSYSKIKIFYVYILFTLSAYAQCLLGHCGTNLITKHLLVSYLQYYYVYFSFLQFFKQLLSTCIIIPN